MFSKRKANVYKRLRRKLEKLDWFSEYYPLIQGMGIQESQSGQLRICFYHLSTLSPEVKTEIVCRVGDQERWPCMWEQSGEFKLD